MKVLEKGEDFVEVEVEEDYTLLTPLTEILNKNSSITQASFASDHPIFKNMKLLIKGKNLKNAVKKACKEISDTCEALLKKL